MTRRARSSIVRSAIETLETRRLLAYSPFGGEVVVDANAGNQFSLDVAVAPNGDYLVATARGKVRLIDGDLQSDMTIRATRYTADGEQVGETLVLDTFDDMHDTQVDVSVSIDATGDAVVAYMVQNQLGDTVQDPSVAKFIRISSSNVASAPVVLTPDHGLDAAIAVSMSDNGSFFVAWTEQELDDNADANYLRVRSFDASGAPRGSVLTPFTESVRPVNFLGAVDVASNPNGTSAVVTFFHERTAVDEGSEFVRVSPSTVVGGLTSIPGDGSTESAKVVMHSTGAFEIAYSLRPRFSSGSALLRRYDPVGVQIGDVVDLGVLTPNPTGLAFSPVIDGLADGGFVVLCPTAKDQIQKYYALRFDSSGTLVTSATSPLQERPSALGFAQDATIAADDDGRLVFAYFQGDEIKYERYSEAAYEVDKSVVYANGSGASDTMIVETDQANVTITRNGSPQTFSLSGVNAISINAIGGNDTIENRTAIPSTLRGGSGNDSIIGGSAKDIIRGHGGNDTIAGGLGSDRILGDAGDDSLLGNAGNDIIDGGDGNDTIRGHGGRDYIAGGNNDDRLYGGASADSLFGGRNSDRLFGEDGNDVLRGDGGVDSLYGSTGNDKLYTDDNTFDKLFGEDGLDHAEVDPNDRLRDVEEVVVPI